jgi:type II secretory pathway component GspD/PulD (secretin)
MRSISRFLLAAIFIAPATLHAQVPKSAPVTAVVESTLKTAGGQIRQFAFDGDADTYFASANNPGKNDHFTLIFDKPIALHAVNVITGKPKGGDACDAGLLEFSADGKTFEKLTEFADGSARFKSDGVKVRALRVTPTADMKHPLAIREFTIQSEPKIAVFKYPIEFVVDVSDAPEMKEWADKVAHVCERNYTMINDELASEGFKPRTQISMTLKNDYKGVAAAGGGRITGSVKFFKAHPDDVGAMVHETVHCVQAYRTRGNPGWLVEDIADYIRFFKYEPGKIGKIAKDPHFDGSYRTSAAFLNFVTTEYDKDLVKKLNKSMREGEYREEIWKVLTKKTLKELDEEWRASMKKKDTATTAASLKVDVSPKRFDLEGTTVEIIPLARSDATKFAKCLQEMFVGWERRGPFIDADSERNALRVRGTPVQHKEVRKVVAILDQLEFRQPIDAAKKDAQAKKPDQPAKEKAPPPAEPPLLQIHSVPGGNAEAIAKLLQEIFPAPNARIVALGPNQIAVWADPQTQIELARQRPLAPGVTVVIPLDQIDPAKTAATLKGMFGEPKTGGPFIEGDKATNSLRIRGSADQLDEIKQALQTLSTHVTGPQNARTITLEEGSAKTVAEALEMLFPRIRANPLKVVLPADLGSDPPKKTLPPEKKDAKQGKGPAPVTIIAFGKTLKIISDDREALEVIEQMVRNLVSTEASGDFEVLRLQYLKATDAARILDEAINGPAAVKGKEGRVERVRVVADSASNSILLRARPLDSLVARRLLASLDRKQETETLGSAEVFPLKNMKAADAARIIGEVFNGPAGKKGKEGRPERIAVVADPATNSIVLRARPLDSLTIRRLLVSLDEMPREQKRERDR